MCHFGHHGSYWEGSVILVTVQKYVGFFFLQSMSRNLKRLLLGPQTQQKCPCRVIIITEPWQKLQCWPRCHVKDNDYNYIFQIRYYLIFVIVIAILYYIRIYGIVTLFERCISVKPSPAENKNFDDLGKNQFKHI